MADFFDWRQSSPQDVITAAIQHLAEGRLVAFPTDTTYMVAASGLSETAVRRLLQTVPGTAAGAKLTVAVRGIGDALDWVPGMSRMGRRLAGRCWPGPLTLEFAAGQDDGMESRLPP